MFKLFSASLKVIVRDRQLLFWSFMFPLMFTFIFGFFFGKGNNSAGTIAVVDQSKTELAQSLDKALTDSGLFKITDTDSADSIKNLMKKNKAAAGLVIPENFGSPVPGSPTQIQLIEDPGNSTTNSVLSSYVNSYLTQANFQINNIKPTFSITEEKTNSHTLSYFDFVLIGLLGMALMNSSVQGIAIGMSKYREDKILKRITTTPLPTWRFIVAHVLSRLVINVLQISLILAIGKWFFDAHIYGNIVLVFGFSIIGAILFQLIGFAIAGLTKTTQAAEGMATTVTIPMMFLAGVFFPIDSLPKWLFTIVQYLPLAPLLRMLRGIALDSNSPFTNPIDIGIVLGWIALTLLVSVYKFRLNDE